MWIWLKTEHLAHTENADINIMYRQSACLKIQRYDFCSSCVRLCEHEGYFGSWMRVSMIHLPAVLIESDLSASRLDVHMTHRGETENRWWNPKRIVSGCLWEDTDMTTVEWKSIHLPVFSTRLFLFWVTQKLSHNAPDWLPSLSFSITPKTFILCY